MAGSSTVGHRFSRERRWRDPSTTGEPEARPAAIWSPAPRWAAPEQLLACLAPRWCPFGRRPGAAAAAPSAGGRQAALALRDYPTGSLSALREAIAAAMASIRCRAAWKMAPPSCFTLGSQETQRRRAPVGLPTPALPTTPRPWPAGAGRGSPAPAAGGGPFPAAGEGGRAGRWERWRIWIHQSPQPQGQLWSRSTWSLARSVLPW